MKNGKTLKLFFKTCKIDKTLFLEFNDTYIASEHAHAMSLFSNSFFKQKINQQILKYFLNPSQIIEFGKVKENFKTWEPKKNFLNRLISSIFQTKKTKYLISHSGLSKFDNIMLNLSLKQLPLRFEFDYFKSFKTKIEKNIRKKITHKF